MSDALSFVIDVPADPRWFEAHFPGLPIVPGVVLLSALEAGCREAFAGLGMLAAVRHLRFLQPVRAPQVLRATVRVRGEWLHCTLALPDAGSPDGGAHADVLRAQLRFSGVAASPVAA